LETDEIKIKNQGMWKDILYDPWTITIGGTLVVSFITWTIRYISSRLKRNIKATASQRESNKEKTSIEHVAPLVLIIDEESRENIQFWKLGNVVKEIYKEKGFEASVLSYSRTTGRLEIKNGNRKEIVSPLIGKLVLEFNIKSIELLN